MCAGSFFFNLSVTVSSSCIIKAFYHACLYLMEIKSSAPDHSVCEQSNSLVWGVCNQVHTYWLCMSTDSIPSLCSLYMQCKWKMNVIILVYSLSISLSADTVDTYYVSSSIKFDLTAAGFSKRGLTTVCEGSWLLECCELENDLPRECKSWTQSYGTALHWGRKKTFVRNRICFARKVDIFRREGIFCLNGCPTHIPPHMIMTIVSNSLSFCWIACQVTRIEHVSSLVESSDNVRLAHRPPMFSLTLFMSFLIKPSWFSYEFSRQM